MRRRAGPVNPPRRCFHILLPRCTRWHRRTVTIIIIIIFFSERGGEWRDNERFFFFIFLEIYRVPFGVIRRTGEYVFNNGKRAARRPECHPVFGDRQPRSFVLIILLLLRLLLQLSRLHYAAAIRWRRTVADGFYFLTLYIHLRPPTATNLRRTRVHVSSITVTTAGLQQRFGWRRTYTEVVYNIFSRFYGSRASIQADSQRFGF